MAVRSTLEQPGYAIPGGSVRVEWIERRAQHFPTDEVGTGLGVASAVVSVKHPVIGALLAIAALTVDHLSDRPNANSAVFAWGAPGATYFPDRRDDLVHQYVMQPTVELEYRTTFGKADEYGLAGYLGPAYHAVERFNGGRRIQQHFVRDGEGGGALE